MGTVHLLHVAVDVAQILLLAAEELLTVANDAGDDDQAHREDAQGNQGHPGADGQHHDEHAQQQGHLGDHLGQALVQSLGDGVHVIGDTAEHFAVGHLVKVRHGQTVNFLADVGAHGVADFGGDTRHEPALDVVEQGAEQVQTAQEQQNLGQSVKVNGARAGNHSHQAFKQLGGGLAQNLRTKDGKCGARNGAHQSDDEHGEIALHITQQLNHSALEIGCLFSHRVTAAHGAVSHRSCHYANSSFES